MWQGFTIALREGIESFLIVALILAYLRRTGREKLARAAFLGIVTSLFVCAAAGFGLTRAANQPLWEGILAGVAVILVSSFLIYMLRTAKTLKADMEKRIESLAGRAGPGEAGSAWGVFFFTVFMITREGMEATMLLITAVFQAKAAPVAGGVLLGLLAAAAVAITWKQLGRAVNIGILLKVSAAFLAIFLVQLCLYTVHELSEAGVLPAAQAIHDATEILGPDGAIGHVLTWLLAAIPLAWLAFAWARGHARASANPAQRSELPASARVAEDSLQK
jgi:high-affinity iron transporter